MGTSWGPLGWHFGSFGGTLGDSGGKIGVEYRHGRFLFFGSAVLEASRGRFSGFLEVVLDQILKIFRGPSAQQTEHAKSTFYLHSEHFGPNFLDVRTFENTVFYNNFGS